MELTDRYEALAMPLPVPWTVCRGGCEGVGVYPMSFEAWEADEERPAIHPQFDGCKWEAFPPEDGTVWALCPSCHGSGLRLPRLLARVLGTIYGFYYPVSWLWLRQQVRFEDEDRIDAAKDTPRMVGTMWREATPYRRMLWHRS